MLVETAEMRDRTIRAVGAVEGLKQTLGRLGYYVTRIKESSR